MAKIKQKPQLKCTIIQIEEHIGIKRAGIYDNYVNKPKNHNKLMAFDIYTYMKLKGATYDDVLFAIDIVTSHKEHIKSKL